MTDDWFVPGPYIDTGVRRMRLRPPETWERYELEIPETPPSMNTDKIRNWRSYYEIKRNWQSWIETLLMEQKVGRNCYQRAIAGCFMRFALKKDLRDPPNFGGVVTKALGDGLVAYQALPDDGAQHYVWGGVEFEEETGPNRTRIVLFFQPQQEES